MLSMFRLFSSLALPIASMVFSPSVVSQTVTPDTSSKPTTSSESSSILNLEVIDSYVEVRTGPGRGYPIFYVIEQGETVEVLKQRVGWYEVRAQNGKVGWATSKQLSRTLQDTGEPANLPSVSFGDYQKNKLRVGFTAGQFFDGELDGVDIFSATLSYRFYGWLSLEGELGKLFDSDIEGDFYDLSLLIEPFSHWRFSPELILGRGNISIDTQPQQVSLEIDDSNFTNYGLGLNYYLGRNFVIRSEYRRYSVSTDNDDEALESWKIGFNTFF